METFMLPRFAFSCALLVVSSSLSAQSMSRDEEAVKSALVRLWKAVETRDIAAYAALIHPNFTQFGEYDLYLASGKDVEVRAMESYFSRARDVSTEMHQPQVSVRGDIAWITYYWTDSGLLEGKRFTSRGKSTRIFARENGQWLCIHGHYTAVP
jgi:ketosteroid isomerase-like protein